MQLLSTRGGKHRHRGTFTLQCTVILKRTRPGPLTGRFSKHALSFWNLEFGFPARLASEAEKPAFDKNGPHPCVEHPIARSQTSVYLFIARY
jgi:hypothetical protein